MGAAVFSAAWLAVAARHLTLTDFSDLALVIALGSLAFFLSDPGTSILVAAHVAQTGAVQPDQLARAVRIRVVGSGAALAVVTAAYLVAANDRDPLIPLLFFGSMVGNAVHTTFSAALRSVDRVGVEAGNEVASRVAVLAVGATWLATGGGLRAAVAVYSIAELASSAALALVVRRHLRAHPAPASAPPMDLSLRRSLPLALGGGLSTVYGRADTWLVALLGTPVAAGIYGAAYRVMEVLYVPARAVGSIALSEGSRPSADRDRGPRSLAAAGAVIVGGGAIALAIAGPRVMTGLFGAEFDQGATALRILAVAALVGAAGAMVGPLAAARRGPAQARAVAAALTVNVGLNVFLIPRHGVTGAAVAFLASEAMLTAMLVPLVYRRRSS